MDFSAPAALLPAYALLGLGAVLARLDHDGTIQTALKRGLRALFLPALAATSIAQSPLDLNALGLFLAAILAAALIAASPAPAVRGKLDRLLPSTGPLLRSIPPDAALLLGLAHVSLGRPGVAYCVIGLAPLLFATHLLTALAHRKSPVAALSLGGIRFLFDPLMLGAAVGAGLAWVGPNTVGFVANALDLLAWAAPGLAFLSIGASLAPPRAFQAGAFIAALPKAVLMPAALFGALALFGVDGPARDAAIFVALTPAFMDEAPRRDPCATTFAALAPLIGLLLVLPLGLALLD